MGLEGRKLPEKHQLPLDVRDSKLLAQSGESDAWKADVIDSKGAERRIVLKENRQLEFSSDEEMRRSKEYYEYLKHSPQFGKFIPDTLYFKARVSEGEAPKAFCIQHLLPGKTVNRFSNDELYADQEVVRELAEFVDAAIGMLQKTRKEWRIKPDFGKSPDDDEHGTHMANMELDPRYSNNILIADNPDEHGRRVFFVDTGEGVRERKELLWRVFQREYIGRKNESKLEDWKRELEDKLASLKSHE